MGTIPTPDYTEGDQCSRCWGVGKEFGDNQTPERILAIVSGITKCPGQLTNIFNGNWILNQHGDNPCVFSYGDAVLDIYFQFSEFAGSWQSRAQIVGFVPLVNVFVGKSTECSTIIFNEKLFATCGIAGQIFYGGQIEVFWGPEI